MDSGCPASGRGVFSHTHRLSTLGTLGIPRKSDQKSGFQNQFCQPRAGAYPQLLVHEGCPERKTAATQPMSPLFIPHGGILSGQPSDKKEGPQTN